MIHAPIPESPVDGETQREKSARIARNRLARDRWAFYMAERCRCGMTRSNVVHEEDPEHSPEGAAYHADFEHHVFEPIS